MQPQFYKEAITAPIFNYISKASQLLGVKSYVIGGFVRDFFLQRGDAKDIDVVAIGSGIELANKVADLLPGKPKVQIFKTYGTAMLKTDEIEIEFVGARKESYSKESRNPVVENGSLEDDQNRRDFTINALALSLNEQNFGDLLDPFGGIDHLRQKLIKTPLNPDITYSDDPLRMMRAIRFATQLNFRIEEASLEAITRNHERIEIITKERIVDELNKIIKKYLQEGYKPVITICAYSHGGNVALYLSDAENIYKESLKIDKLVLYGTPIQEETALFAHDEIFKKIYNFYSQADQVQHNDSFSTSSSQSFRTFKDLYNYNSRYKLDYYQKIIDIRLLAQDDAMIFGHFNFWYFNRYSSWPTKVKPEIEEVCSFLDPLPIAILTPIFLYLIAFIA